MTDSPVVNRAAVAAVVTAIAGGLTLFGIDVGSNVINAITDAVLVLAPLVVIAWAALSARALVTPLDAPRDNDGRPLVPKTPDAR